MGAAKGTVPWNAGTGKGWVDKRGYRWLYVSENGKRRARREHRVIVELHLGRRLEPWEVVHHKDGNTMNNTIENLEVFEFGAHTAAHHDGSRKGADARRSMEAFALMREELKAERAVKADLLAAAMRYLEDRKEAGCTADSAGVKALRAAVAKATGEAP